MNICKPFGSRPPWWKATFPPLVRSLKYTWKFNRETLRKSIHGKSVTCFTISWYHFENWAIPAGHVVSDKATLCQYVQWNFVELFRSVWFGPFDETVLCDFLIGCPHRGSTNQEATRWSKGKDVRNAIFKPCLSWKGDETMDEFSPVNHFTTLHNQYLVWSFAALRSTFRR